MASAVTHRLAAVREAEGLGDRDAVIARERNLLYVAMTRARHELVVSWHGRRSEFLKPLTDSAGR